MRFDFTVQGCQVTRITCAGEGAPGVKASVCVGVRWHTRDQQRGSVDAMNDRESLETHFRTMYTARYVRVARRLEEAALGHAVGLHGYTTLAQAQVLADTLALVPSQILVDMGAGRGWPGLYLAQSSGCHLVALDLPYDAMAAAQAHMPACTARCVRAAVVADGRAVPLGADAVAAVVHADSF